MTFFFKLSHSIILNSFYTSFVKFFFSSYKQEEYYGVNKLTLCIALKILEPVPILATFYIYCIWVFPVLNYYLLLYLVSSVFVLVLNTVLLVFCQINLKVQYIHQMATFDAEEPHAEPHAKVGAGDCGQYVDLNSEK